MRLGVLCAATLFCGVVRAQAPVVEARGVVNGVTFELAPSTVAPGGIFNVYGFNLAASTALASSLPLPTSLGSPAVEVSVNGRPAPLYFVSGTQINAQAPWETEAGQALVIVKRGGVASRPATITVQPSAPSLFVLNGAGFGPAIALSAGNGKLLTADNPPAGGDVLTLFASGLGPVDPAVGSGAPGPSGPLSRATRNQRAWVNGFAAPVLFAGLAPGFAGLFQVNLQLPDPVAAGDVLQYFSGGQMANRVTLGSPPVPRVRFMPLPDGVAAVAATTDTDLNGGFVAMNGPRDADGCFQNVYLLDFRRRRTTPVTECLVDSAPNAPSPFVAEAGTSRLAALVGPAVGTAPAGISSTVLILDGATGQKRTIALPAPALNLTAGVQGTRGLVATLPGDTLRLASSTPIPARCKSRQVERRAG